MELLLDRLIPLYTLALLGFLAGKRLGITKESLAPLLIYILSPAVVFFAVLGTAIDGRIVYLPAITFLCSAIVCLISFQLAKLYFRGSVPNLLAFAGGDANSGYFGIPVALAIFGSSYLSSYIMAAFGVMIYENTLGYYITARGNYSHRDAFTRLIRLPTLYAFALAIILNGSGLILPQSWVELGTNLRGAYSVLGMMIIGLGIASLRKWSIDWSFNIGVSLAKFALWPLVMIMVLAGDAYATGLIDPTLRAMLFFIATLPLAANTVTFAADLQVEPERAAVAVLLSTIVAAGVIPLGLKAYHIAAPWLFPYLP